MGVFASSQFSGVFFGGVLGGALLETSGVIGRLVGAVGSGPRMGLFIECVAFGVTNFVRSYIKNPIALPETLRDWYSDFTVNNAIASHAFKIRCEAGDTGEYDGYSRH